jgi:hypothetical protein
MSNLHEMIVAARNGSKPAIQHSTDSPRAGTRTTRTKKKTARACGRNYEPTGSWQDRSQGVEAGKQKRMNALRGLKSRVKEMKKGDGKAMA